jgi:hypothetical protein
MYMVISMPKRNSVACGVSHFMSILLKVCKPASILPLRLPPANQRHHETDLMIFMSHPRPSIGRHGAPRSATERHGAPRKARVFLTQMVLDRDP